MKFFSAIFKPDLHDIKLIFHRHIHIGQPIENIHFITATGITGPVILAT
jgi:hypothetical protein